MAISPKARILLADDETTFLASTTELLRAEGYRVTAVADAFQAQHHLDNGDIDLVIADINMPGNSDLELIRNMAQSKLTIPVVLVTGYPSLDTAINSVELPISAYVVKPVDFDELLKHIRGCLAKHTAVQAMSHTSTSLEKWMGELSKMQDSMKQETSNSLLVSLEKFVELTAFNMGKCLTDLVKVSEALDKRELAAPACHLMNCPTLQTLTDAVFETIDVLEKTKQSFRSKELGKLRRKLTDLVDQLDIHVSNVV